MEESAQLGFQTGRPRLWDLLVAGLASPSFRPSETQWGKWLSAVPIHNLLVWEAQRKEQLFLPVGPVIIPQRALIGHF